MEVNQYEIVLVNLDPTVGSEIQKTRPCVVISPNEINHNLRTVVIAPMTTKSRTYPTRVKVKHNSQTGWVVIDQIRTIDKIRIVKNLGQLNSSEAAACKRIIKETFVD
ncbi:type II toxin-antitoxin system PemK/MazF family toxin [Rufibacter glacialis]|uniref:mRNA interferase n=1 Tax=Rufibacter glacialis TaxID=1259555 RepID=A0A5M8QDY5_9BACT|nr:type II toxin-antitoxin system PemK/MazF family toxin [Rufibacter glacialis]KAA6433223.1 type II toxin-antitoxin system PemK/MazF family toxin [Rufibacter glacialis]GGK76326.1 mRNA interferase [Rufibacter glacialis]